MLRTNIVNVLLIPESQLPVSITESAFDVRDLVQRVAGGRNPLSNIGVRYTGSTDDAALNRDVARFAADPTAAAAVKADGDPTGVLPVPVVTIHPIDNPDRRPIGRSATFWPCPQKCPDRPINDCNCFAGLQQTKVAGPA